MNFLDKLKGYRTVTVSAIVSITGLLVAFGVIDIAGADAINENADLIFGGILTVLGGVFAVLRKITDTPIGES